MTSRKKLLMVALDAADIGFIRASLAHLPALRRVLDEGVFFPLTSTAQYIAASVWPTFYTGTLPGEHGISQHIQWDPERMRMRRLSADWFHCEPFWYDLARRGFGVTVLDVPFTFPNRLPAAVEVSNWGSHDLMGPLTANPEGLGREIRWRFGRHPMGYEIPVGKSPAQLEAMRRELREGAERKARVACWLRDNTRWDFFLTVFGETHRGGHILWRETDDLGSAVPVGALLEVYQAVDAGVGRLLEGIDLATTTAVIFSLHGMGPNPSQEHFIRRVMDRVNSGFVTGHGGGSAPIGPQRGVMRSLRERLPARLQHAVARMVPVGVRDWVVSREVTGGLHWSRTLGFALRSDLHCFVRFNLAGRERQGVLEPDGDVHRRYRDGLVEHLLALRVADTGAPVVQDVVEAQRLFAGPRSGLLPDLIIRWARQAPAARICSERLGTLSAEPDSGRTGEHRPGGFALVLGGQPRDRLVALRHDGDFLRFVRHVVELEPLV